MHYDKVIFEQFWLFFYKFILLIKLFAIDVLYMLRWRFSLYTIIGKIKWPICAKGIYKSRLVAARKVAKNVVFDQKTVIFCNKTGLFWPKAAFFAIFFELLLIGIYKFPLHIFRIITCYKTEVDRKPHYSL